MTDKLYLITEAQRYLLLANHLLLKHETDLLKSLPMVDSEPVATVTDVPPAFSYSTYIRWHNSPPPPTGTCLYTSPQALTPITADDLTAEMIHNWHANTFGAQAMGGVTDRDLIVAAVNAYNAVIKHRSEA